uniref:Uncharacterized protein n=2 Tax=Triticum urartu TaxID=4572 RepID=A0A8R7PH81_TRIUA
EHHTSSSRTRVPSRLSPPGHSRLQDGPSPAPPTAARRNGGRAPMASPEVTFQPSFSFKLVGIRPDPDGSGCRRPIPDLPASPGSSATLMSSILVTGSSATDGWPPPRLDVTQPHRRL